MKAVILALGTVVLMAAVAVANKPSDDIWVLTEHDLTGHTAVGDSYTRYARALKVARALRAEQHVWVTVDPSTLHESNGNGFGLLLFPRLSAQQVIDLNASLVLPQALRQAGEYISPSVQPRAGAGIAFVTMSLNIPTADYENTANAITMNIEQSFDSSDWSAPFVACGVTWVGGRWVTPQGIIDPAPSSGCNLATRTDRWSRAHVTFAHAMTAGVTVTTQ